MDATIAARHLLSVLRHVRSNVPLVALACSLGSACTGGGGVHLDVLVPSDGSTPSFDSSTISHDGSTPPSDASTDPSDVARLGSCPRPGFGPGVSWPIPRRALRLAEQGDASAAPYLYSTIDLDGDERPDFVVTYDLDAPLDDLSWTYYRNAGDGFDPTPRRWPIPRRALRLSEQGDASAAISLHTTFDIDGDLRPDFVVTYDASGSAGASQWLVFRNNGTGFDSSPINWPVPLRALHTSEQGDASAANALFTTVDMDGDRRPDLVVTYQYGAPPDARTWWVYRNTGSGFATTPDSWSVPIRALRASEQGDASAALSLYALVDINGDERPDFVRTYDVSGLAGDGVWLVHLNDGHAFAATPIQWTVPGRALHLTEQGDASAAFRLWATTPTLRRGPLDFMGTFDQSGAGDLQWLEYPNAGTGFAPNAIAWPIPFRALRMSEQGDASAAFELHVAMDLDGDRASDFVSTYENGTAVGITEWRLYRACGP